MKYDDWYVWVHMDKSAITLPVFQSLDAYWPGLQVSTFTFKTSLLIRYLVLIQNKLFLIYTTFYRPYLVILGKHQGHYTNTTKYGSNLALLLNFIKLHMDNQSVAGRAIHLGLVSSFYLTDIIIKLSSSFIIYFLNKLSLMVKLQGCSLSSIVGYCYLSKG